MQWRSSSRTRRGSSATSLVVINSAACDGSAASEASGLIGALTGLMFCGFPAHILAAGDLTAWLGWDRRERI
jgi:hypothetical protein